MAENRFKEEPVSPEFLGVMGDIYRTIRIYDDAQPLAVRTFQGIDDPDRIGSIFQELYSRTTDEDEQKRLGCAFNFAYISAMIKKGYGSEAKQVLDHLASQEVLLVLINESLSDLRTSFQRLCLSSGRLLSPRDLDQIVFDSYAPESRDLSQDYYNKQGIAVVSPLRSPEGYQASLIFDKTQGRKVVNDKTAMTMGFVGIRLYTGEFKCKKDPELVKKLTSGAMGSKGLTDYGIIYANNPCVVNYLRTIFAARRIGKAIDQLTTLSSLGKHGIETVPIREN